MKSDKITTNTPRQTIALVDVNTVKDIIVNSFSIKDTIIEVLQKYRMPGGLNDIEIERIAKDMKETSAVKMRLKQGSYE